MPQLDTRPGRLDVLVRAANSHSFVFTWPAVLTGRTFTANVDGTALGVVVAGATVTVTFSAAVTASLAGRLVWELVETTVGSQVLITGRVLASDSGTESQDSTVTVTVEESAVAVTVLGQPGTSGAGGNPATTVVTETAFGQASAVGVGTQQAREDHTHGSPTDPVPAHAAAADPHAGYRLESVAITDADVAVANKDGLAAVPSLRTLGATATAAAAGNDARLSDQRVPVDGSVTTMKIADAAVTAAKVAADVATQAELDAVAAGAVIPVRDEGVTVTADPTAINFVGAGVTASDVAGVATVTIPGGGSVTPATSVVAETAYGQASAVGVGTQSAREDHTHGSPALGTTGLTAAAGNDARLPAGADIVDADVGAAAAIAESKLALASDAAAGVASRRTLGTTATSAAAGNDGRLSDQRTPLDLSVTDAKVAAANKDGLAAVPSMRTLGTTATSAAAGDDARIVGALQRAGGTMTGAIVLAADGAAALNPVTKQQLDSATSAAVPKALVDLKGDLIVATAPDVVGRLPVGANGQVLTADSVEASGVKWAAVAGGGSAADLFAPVAYAAVRPYSVPGWAITAQGPQHALNLDATFYYPISIATARTADRIAVNVVTAVAAGGRLRLGIYNANTSWQPSTLVLDAGEVVTDSTGIKELIINQALPVGRYLLACNARVVNGPGIRLVEGAAPSSVMPDNILDSTLRHWSKFSQTITTFPATGVAWDIATLTVGANAIPIFLRFVP